MALELRTICLPLSQPTLYPTVLRPSQIFQGIYGCWNVPTNSLNQAHLRNLNTVSDLESKRWQVNYNIIKVSLLDRCTQDILSCQCNEALVQAATTTHVLNKYFWLKNIFLVFTHCYVTKMHVLVQNLPSTVALCVHKMPIDVAQAEWILLSLWSTDPWLLPICTS